MSSPKKETARSGPDPSPHDRPPKDGRVVTRMSQIARSLMPEPEPFECSVIQVDICGESIPIDLKEIQSNRVDTIRGLLASGTSRSKFLFNKKDDDGRRLLLEIPPEMTRGASEAALKVVTEMAGYLVMKRGEIGPKHFDFLLKEIRKVITILGAGCGYKGIAELYLSKDRKSKRRKPNDCKPKDNKVHGSGDGEM